MQPWVTHTFVVLYSKEKEIKYQDWILTWGILQHNCHVCVLKQYSSYTTQYIYRKQCLEIPWYPSFILTVSQDHFFFFVSENGLNSTGNLFHKRKALKERHIYTYIYICQDN